MPKHNIKYKTPLLLLYAVKQIYFRSFYNK